MIKHISSLLILIATCCTASNTAFAQTQKNDFEERLVAVNALFATQTKVDGVKCPITEKDGKPDTEETKFCAEVMLSASRLMQKADSQDGEVRKKAISDIFKNAIAKSFSLNELQELLRINQQLATIQQHSTYKKFSVTTEKIQAALQAGIVGSMFGIGLGQEAEDGTNKEIK